MTPLLAKLFARVGLKPTTNYGMPIVPKLSRKGGRDKSDLPHGYPGAKMARKAVMKRVGVKHLGLRLDGVTV